MAVALDTAAAADAAAPAPAVYKACTFADLEGFWAEWEGACTAAKENGAGAEDLPAPPRVTVSGYVVALRQMSAKLYFFDLLEDVDRPDKHVEGLVRLGKAGDTKEAIAAHRGKCTITNQIEMSGVLTRTHRGGMVVEVSAITLIRTFDAQPEAVGNTRTMKRHQLDDKDEQALIKKLHQHVTHLSQTAEKQQIGVAPQKPLCKAWWKGRCQKGTRCEFRHEFKDDAEKARCEAAAARSAQDKAAYAHGDDPHDNDKQSHNLRATLFADWLVTTFGREHLTRGSGVLDIAGGAGAVSFELHVRRAIPTTLIDPRSPRPIKQHRLFLKHMFKRFKREDAAAAAAAGEEGVPSAAPSSPQILVDADADADAAFPAPKRRKVETAATQGAVSAAADAAAAVAGVDDAAAGDGEGAEGGDAQHTRRGLAMQGGVGVDAADEVHYRSLFDACGGDFKAHMLPHRAMMVEGDEATLGDPLFKDSSALVGMHPDQATCPIIDTALALNKPFCVVPCCVFPKLFPNRRTPGGELVSTYPQYLEYILRKDKRLRTAHLPFKGRNCVVYLHPDDVAAGEKQIPGRCVRDIPPLE